VLERDSINEVFKAMYVPIHQFPQSVFDQNREYRKRWESLEGRRVHDQVMNLIREGTGKHFLDTISESEEIFEDSWDLKGVSVSGENITFPQNDTFMGVDFSYSAFSNTKMKNAVFSCTMQFVVFHNCTFEKCLFEFNRCHASRFEKVTFIDCDFVESNAFTNCSFDDTSFTKTFFSENVFLDCRFDNETYVGELPRTPVLSRRPINLPDSSVSDIYNGIKEAYRAGGVVTKAREYLFRQLHAATRYNSENWKEKTVGILSEYVTGHGLRPVRVLLTIAIVFTVVLSLFCYEVPWHDALLLTCGAMFTFGAKADLLDGMGVFYPFLYVLSSFAGITLTALFIAVVFNRLVREK
jgi:hypothetical protein